MKRAMTPPKSPSRVRDPDKGGTIENNILHNSVTKSKLGKNELVARPGLASTHSLIQVIKKLQANLLVRGQLVRVATEVIQSSVSLTVPGVSRRWTNSPNPVEECQCGSLLILANFSDFSQLPTVMNQVWSLTQFTSFGF